MIRPPSVVNASKGGRKSPASKRTAGRWPGKDQTIGINFDGAELACSYGGSQISDGKRMFMHVSAGRHAQSDFGGQVRPRLVIW